MRSLSLFLFFSFVLTYVCCRPGKYEIQAVNQAEESEDYSEEDEGAANNDRGQQDNEEEANENDHEETELQPQPKQSETKYKDNHEDSDKQNPQCAYNEAIDAFKQNLRTADNSRVNKRSETNAVSSKNDEGDLLFENYLRNQQKSNRRIAINNRDEIQDLGKQSRYYRRYYSTDNLKQPSRSYESDSTNLNRNRNRREVPKDAIASDVNVKLKDQLETQAISSEEEEAAIKRHVNKLSSDELEQLLNSLSDDKRNLLKNIIDNESESSLIKREITKKAGAVEENNLMESGQLQSGSSDSSVSQNTDAPETAKKSENVSSNDLFSGCSADTTSENKADFISSSDENQQLLSTVSGEQAQSVSTFACSSVQDVSAAASTKSANKREAHSDDYNPNPDETADKTYYSQQDSETGYLTAQEEEDDSPDAEDNESANETEMPRKREVSYQKYSELSDSERSLEESFPNSEAYKNSDPYAESDMLPLVRVKRKNKGSVSAVLKKRAAAIMPDAKIGYVPYKAENDDEDNDEANELDDNGFYDRTPNLNFNDMSSKTDTNSEEQEVELINDERNRVNLKDDKGNLGSDTDGVLSGVEGVDENLMLSKQNSDLVAQNSDVVELNANEETNQIRVRRSVPEERTSQKDTEKTVNAPICHEIDSFGPLLQAGDAETSRFKRIRRVKQLSDSGKTNS